MNKLMNKLVVSLLLLITLGSTGSFNKVNAAENSNKVQELKVEVIANRGRVRRRRRRGRRNRRRYRQSRRGWKNFRSRHHKSKKVILFKF